MIPTIKLALQFKSIFLKEKRHRLEQLLSDMRFAAAAILFSVLSVLLIFTLLSLLKTHTIPWLYLLSLADEVLFIIGFLLTLFSLIGYGKYLFWHLVLKGFKLFAGKVSRAGRAMTAVVSVLSQLVSLAQKQTQQQSTAFWRQLRQRLAQHPPHLWSASKAPLPLFQQAALRLAP